MESHMRNMEHRQPDVQQINNYGALNNQANSNRLPEQAYDLTKLSFTLSNRLKIEIPACLATRFADLDGNFAELNKIVCVFVKAVGK